jgi:glutathione-regulated potassium-efflux system ancillary protein KefF
VRGAAAAVRDLPSSVRSLYELYPDFDIDHAAERAVLEKAKLVVWLHPLYRYGLPALMKHWLDRPGGGLGVRRQRNRARGQGLPVGGGERGRPVRFPRPCPRRADRALLRDEGFDLILMARTA